MRLRGIRETKGFWKVIHQSSGKHRQKVYIEYDLVGYIPVDELLKAEQA